MIANNQHEMGQGGYTSAILPTQPSAQANTAPHERIMSDRIQLDSLVEIVQQNTQAMTRLTSLVEQHRTEAK